MFMKILCLYNNDIAIELFKWLEMTGNNICLRSERLEASWCLEQFFDLTVSYIYRYILMQDVINALNNNVVNIHNSYLPWNRGADPNIWSVLDGTPRGVTLHYIDNRLDHGDIIAQILLPQPRSLHKSKEREAEECDKTTLLPTYNELDQAAKKLFMEAFQYHPFWDSMRKYTKQAGSCHKSSDASALKATINSYDISIDEFKLLIDQKRGGISQNNFCYISGYREVCVA